MPPPQPLELIDSYALANSRLLAEIGLGQYAARFAARGLEMPELVGMARDDPSGLLDTLRDLGVDPRHGASISSALGLRSAPLRPPGASLVNKVA